MKTKGSNILFFLLLMFSACVEPFDSPVNNLPNNYLVVEGIISDGRSSFRLSRTSNLNEGDILAETYAQVYIENQSGTSSYVLNETETGLYEAVLDLDNNDRYRVKIFTASDAQYVSEYVALTPSPKIDSITLDVVNGEVVQLNVTTHDPNKNTRYYRWTYQETWEYYAAFPSGLEYVDGEIVSRDYINNQIYNCWQSSASNQILVASSVQLQEDVIYKQPLLSIRPASSNKLDVRYSILVQQYALTKEAFEYWDLLKKNSESLGTLFDPQPSQLPGNLQCVSNPDEPVLGFVSAGAFDEKRLFVRRSEIPFSFPYNRNTSCQIDTVSLSPDALESAFGAGDSIPLTEVYGVGGFEGYEATSTYCADCRARGGTNVKPDFWE